MNKNKNIWIMIILIFIFLSTLSADEMSNKGNNEYMRNANLSDLKKELQDPFIEGLYKRTYQSIIDRVENDGYFQESVNGAYIGMFPRTVGGLVSLFLETGEMEKARKLVDVVLKSAKANGMHRCPHVMGRKVTENIPYSDSDSIISLNHDIPLYKLNDGFHGAQRFSAPNDPVVAVEAWLSSGYNGKATITCSISSSLNDIKGFASAVVSKDAISESGNWVRFKFSKPVELYEGRSYYIHVIADGDSDCIWWGDVNKDNPLVGGFGFDPNVKKWHDEKSNTAAFAVDTGNIKHKKSTTYPIFSRMDQLDGNFHVLTAWAMVVLNSNVKKWEDSTYAQVVDMTNTAIDSPYLFPKVDRIWPGLIHNFCLEHSREGRYWDTWDLLTQSWACRGLRLLEKAAIKRDDAANARKWRNAYTQIEDAIKDKLTMQVDGKTVYAEMRLTDGGDGKLFDGLSWVNLSPVQAQWDGADADILRNTIHTYREKAKMNWHGRTVTSVHWTPSTGAIDPQVIGKGVGWDIVYALEEKDYNTIINWLHFIKDENYTDLYAEAFNLIDGETVIQDPGNGEQVSWWCWGIAKARKAAGLSAVPD